MFAREGESISGHKGTSSLLRTAEGFGVALHPSPAAAYGVAVVILLCMEIFVPEVFPIWEVQPETFSSDKCRGK